MWQCNQVNSGKEVTKQLLGSNLPEAATYEMNDFELIAILELGRRPAITREQFAIEFDGDAVGLHVELEKEG